MANAAITVDLNARIAQFESEMKRANGTLDKFSKNTTAVGSLLKTAFSGAAVVGLVAFAKSGIDAADSLNDMSIRLGVSVKDLASFKLAAEQSGTSLDSVGAGIARMSRSIGDAEGGNKKLAQALKDLGVTARDPKEAFFQLADAVERIQDPAQRATLLNQVLGKSYQELVPLLSQGSDALRQSAKESETFAEAMSRLAPEADKFNDNLAKLKINAAGFAGTIIADLVPALNQLFERYMNIKTAMAGGFIAGIGLSGTLSTDIPKVNKEVRELESTIARLKKNSGGLDSSIAPLSNQLANLKKTQAALKAESLRGAMEIAQQQYKKTPQTNAVTKTDTKKPKTGGTKSDPQGAFIDKLRQEANTLGLTGEALQRYEAAKLKLTGSNKKLADSYIAQIAAFKEQQEVAKANNDAFDEAIKKQDELDSALEGSIKSVREWIAEQEFEVTLIGLTNTERESAIQLRALETAGIDTQTESYRQLAEQVAAANSDKRGISILSGTQTEKTKEFMSDIDSLNKLFFDGKIGAQQYSEGIDLITASTKDAKVEMDEFAKNAAESIQKSMADFLFDPFADGLDGMLEGFGKMLQRMIADAAAAQIARELFGGLSDSGKTEGSGWVGSALELFGSYMSSGSANGNAFTSSGVKLQGFSAGGVASGPKSGYPVMMHGTEAILPLKRGANGKLGVESGSGGGSGPNVTQNFYGYNNAPDIRRAAGQGQREIMGMLSAAKRYS